MEYVPMRSQETGDSRKLSQPTIVRVGILRCAHRAGGRKAEWKGMATLEDDRVGDEHRVSSRQIAQTTTLSVVGRKGEEL